MSLRELLANSTVNSLALPTSLVTIDASVTAGLAFKSLMEHHVLSAPVIEAGKGIGLVDMADFVAFIVQLCPDARPTDADMEKLNKQLADAPIKQLMSELPVR